MSTTGECSARATAPYWGNAGLGPWADPGFPRRDQGSRAVSLRPASRGGNGTRRGLGTLVGLRDATNQGEPLAQAEQKNAARAKVWYDACVISSSHGPAPARRQKVAMLSYPFKNLVPFALVFCLASSVAADPAAEHFIREKQQELSGLVKREQKSKIDEVFAVMIDYEALAKDSLAAEWDARTEAERAQFKCILQELVSNSHRKNLKRTLDYEIRYHGTEQAERGILVKTSARNRNNAREEPISIDYLVHRVDGKWRVRDTITDGSSLVNTYRSQFRAMIAKKGFAGLLEKLRAKAGQAANKC